MSKLSIWRNSPMFRLGLALALGLALLIGLLLVMGATHTPEVVLAQGPTTRYVASAPTGNDSGNDCTNSITPCATIGYALDQAGDGDAILVARGTYTENLFITKTVTLKGAYEPVGWSRCLRRCTTTIDGNRSGWVINVQSTLSETPVIDGFTITNGDGGIFIRSLSSVAIQNCKIVHNHRDGWGSGGITADRSYVAITNTLIARNTVTGSYAAMVVLSTPVDPWVESVVRIHNSTIVSNSATGFNGIMCSLSWCVFVNTIVWDHEGEIFDGNPPRYVITYSDIEGGWPGEGNISEDPRFVDPASGDYHLRSDSPCIDAGTSEGAPETDFEGDPRPIGTGYDMGADEYSAGCFARLNDGVIYSTVQAAVDASTQPTDVVKVAGYCSGVSARAEITQVVYISKTVTLRGGYTTTNWTTPDPVANPTTLDAQGQGRVLYITGDISPTIEGLHITGGDATGLGGGPFPGDFDLGGGVYVITATVTVSNSQVFSNTAGWWSWGGGMFFDNSPNATLSDNIISDNKAFQVGGLYFHNSPGAVLIDNTINNNVADHKGWGMKFNGGVLFAHSDDATLIGNAINGNYAANACGGVCFDDSDNAMLIGNAVISNTAGQPGFIVSEGGGLRFLHSTNANLIGNTISDNRTDTFGGGLYIGYNSTVVLTANTISSNKATKGGGVYLSSSDAMLSRNTVTANTVYTYPSYNLDGDGGGLYLDNSTATLTNTIIADNQAETAGSGLYIQGSSLHLLHTTVARNGGGDGSGIYITGTASTVALTNTILVSHTVGITVASGNTAMLEATLWGTDTWANLADWGGAGTIITGTVNLWGAPAFVDPEAGDYHIGPGSAALDAGVDAGVTVDIDGESRPVGAGYDIGADEFSAALAVTKQADPDPVQAGSPLTYTLRVTNTGNVTLTTTITDILPNQVTPTSVLTWTPVTITAPDGTWMQQVVVTVEKGYAGPLTNVVQVTTEEGTTGVYTETSEVEPALVPPVPPIYLPVIFKNW